MPLPGIDEKVAFLSQANAYPVHTESVSVRETHMSWVFLTDTRAWKLKKPVQYDYLDFSTPEARRFDCEEEVRLNRRLAPQVYYGVIPLNILEGNLRLDRDGEPIDWLVCMRRLPADRMLDQAIANRNFSNNEVRKIGLLLADFYQHAPRIEMNPAFYREKITADVYASHQELIKPDHTLQVGLVEPITAQQLEFLEKRAKLFDDRVLTGKIIEAHGDLRPEHICLETKPVIIDCLEFNREFRILDAASELSFLSLECERLGAPEVGRLILQTYFDQTGDNPPGQLLTFYRSFHACLRAKIALWHLKDDGILDRAKWINRARDYLRFASCINSAM